MVSRELASARKPDGATRVRYELLGLGEVWIDALGRDPDDSGHRVLEALPYSAPVVLRRDGGRAVLEAARTLDLKAEERDILPAELIGADEVFVTNALFGIWPVTELDGRRFAVGPITEHLMVHFHYGRA